MQDCLPQSFDVIVVGGRVAGASIAIQLAKAGLNILVIDQDDLSQEKLYSTHFIGLRGTQALKNLGLFNSLANECPVYQSLKLHTPNGILEGAPPAKGDNTDMFGPRRSNLDSLLLKEAKNRGVEFAPNCCLNEVVHKNNRVAGIRCNNRETGNQREYRSRLVIGADGGNSKTAKLVGATILKRYPKLSGLHWAYFRNLPVDNVEFYFSAGSSGAIFGTNNDLTMVTLTTSIPAYKQVQSAKTPQDARHQFLNTIVAASPPLNERLRSASIDTPLRGCSTPNIIRQCSGPGWALIGDAACIHDPASATGISDALVDSQYLARTIVNNWKESTSRFDSAIQGYAENYRKRTLPYFNYWCDSLAYFYGAANINPYFEIMQKAFWASLLKNKEKSKAFLGILSQSYEGDSNLFLKAVRDTAAVDTYHGRTLAV